ncbi:hypothetical protein TWF718_007227 [Orbilia javanica]|uniref:Uncharacterized protein n=1 Tax=Orbilia javanica TaxID=47235 RepID=A0AAN8MXY3_9PEZI
MDQGASRESNLPPPVARDRKRPRLSDPGPVADTKSPQPTRPSAPAPPPPRRPWPTRVTKDDVVSLEERLRYLIQLQDYAEENTAKAQKRVEDLLCGAGSLAMIQVPDSLRTRVTQEEYARARNEQISSEIHRDRHRKISGAFRRFSEPTRLLDIPESRAEKIGRVRMAMDRGGIEKTGRNPAEDVKSRKPLDKVAKEQVSKDGYAAKSRDVKGKTQKENSQMGLALEEPKIEEGNRASQGKRIRERVTLRIPMGKGSGRGHDGGDGPTNKDWVPK